MRPALRIAQQAADGPPWLVIAGLAVTLFVAIASSPVLVKWLERRRTATVPDTSAPPPAVSSSPDVLDELVDEMLTQGRAAAARADRAEERAERLRTERDEDMARARADAVHIAQLTARLNVLEGERDRARAESEECWARVQRMRREGGRVDEH